MNRNGLIGEESAGLMRQRCREVRNPKSEVRKKAETRNPNLPTAAIQHSAMRSGPGLGGQLNRRDAMNTAQETRSGSREAFGVRAACCRFRLSRLSESGSKLLALQTLRDVRAPASCSQLANDLDYCSAETLARTSFLRAHRVSAVSLALRVSLQLRCAPSVRGCLGLRTSDFPLPAFSL